VELPLPHRAGAGLNARKVRGAKVNDERLPPLNLVLRMTGNSGPVCDFATLKPCYGRDEFTTLDKLFAGHVFRIVLRCPLII
jgi:hypothetical protein